MSLPISPTCTWAVALAGVLCLAAPATAAAAVRYAAPGGSGTVCSAETPCDIQEAIEGSTVADGDEVVLTPGSYATANDAVVAQHVIDIHGPTSGPRPLIDSSAGFGVVINYPGATIEDVDVRSSAGGIALLVGHYAHATRVISIATAPGAAGCFLQPDTADVASIEESACIATGSGGTALLSRADVSSGVASLATMQDVTAVATGPSSLGVKAESGGSGGSVTLQGVNVIADGTAADVSAEGNGDSSVFAQMSFSDFDSQLELGNAAVTDPGYESNVTGPALLVDPSAGDVHQRAGSWTIDRGGYVNGSDIDGDLRPQGAAPDIGADELPVLAKAERPKCFGQSATIVAPASGPIEGTPGRDVIVGTPGPDVIVSGAGGDLICGLGGRDTIRSGGGADKVRGGAAGDKLIGARGGDRLLGGGGPDRIKGGPGKDTLAGGGGRDRITGGPGKDKLIGGRGRDRCRASSRDRIRGCP